MKYYVFILLVVLNLNTNAQIGFQKIYGHADTIEHGFDVIQLDDSSYLVTVTQITCDTMPIQCKGNGQLLEIDKTGQLLDLIDIVDTNYHNSSIQLLETENIGTSYISFGIIDTPSSTIFYRNYVTSLNKNSGLINWDLSINDSSGYSPTGNLLVYINGSLYIASLYYYEPTLTKLDTNGSITYSKKVTGPFIYGKSTKGILYFPQDSSFVVAGDGNISVAAKDRWMVRFKENGDTIFTKVLSNYGAGWVTGLSKAYDSNSFYMLGNTLARYDINGNLISDVQYNTFGTCYSMTKTIDSNYIIGGNLGGDFSLTKIDTAGNVIWSKSFDNNLWEDNLHKVIATKDGGYLMCGTTSYNGAADVLLIKVDSVGILNFATSINPISKAENDLLIYPNPTSDNINISTMLKNEIEKIQVLNLQGQIIKTYNRFEPQIDISNLSSGTYIINIQSKTKIISRKIVKR